MDILETAKHSWIKSFTILWNIHPQSALVADGAAALEDEAEEIVPRAGRWRKVHIASGQIRRAIVGQGKKIDLIRRVHGDC